MRRTWWQDDSFIDDVYRKSVGQLMKQIVYKTWHSLYDNNIYFTVLVSRGANLVGGGVFSCFIVPEISLKL